MYHYVRPIRNSEFSDIKGLEITQFQNQIAFFRQNFHFADIDFFFNSLKLEKYERIDPTDMKNYIKSIKNNKYEYEYDENPNLLKLIDDVKTASKKMIEKLKKFNIKLNSNVYIEVNNQSIQIVEGKDQNRKLYCQLDNRLLRRILDQKAHWNNAEIGTHINFKRYPNIMDPDIHTCLSFFHL